jgi:apolipoprotein N-acyltransferase
MRRARMPDRDPDVGARRSTLVVLAIEGALGLVAGLRFLQQAGIMTNLALSGFSSFLGMLLLVPAVLSLIAVWRLRRSRERGRRAGVIAGWTWGVVGLLWLLVGVVSPDAFAVLLGLLLAGLNVLVVRDLRGT